MSRFCGLMLVICCLRFISGGFIIMIMMRGRMLGWSWLSVSGWRNICNERLLLFSVRSCFGCVVFIILVILFFMRCCGR